MRRWLTIASMLCLTLVPPAISQPAPIAQQVQTYNFDLPADFATRTFRLFSQQANVQLLFPTDLVKDLRTHAVRGNFTPRQALELMIAGTPWTVVGDEKSSALGIKRRSSPAPQADPSSKASPPSKSDARRNPLRALVGVLALAFAPTDLNAADAETEGDATADEPVYLSPFEVRTQQDYGYRRTNAITATRIGAAIIDSPLNIAIIGKDFLEDIGVDNIADAFRYTSGISSTAGNEFRPSLRIRGFEPQSLYRDGFLRYYNFDIDGIEQIEVVKGPNAVYFGRGAPGGIINYVTKKPQFKNATEIRATLGDHAYYKGLIDTQSSLLGGKFGTRVVASRLDAESWLDEKTQEKDFILANLRYRPFERLELYASIEHTDNKYRGTGAYGLVQQSTYMAEKASGASPAAESADQWRARKFRETGILPPQYNEAWFPRGHRFNKNGHGSWEEGRDTAIDVQVKLNLARNLDFRLAWNQLQSEAEQGFFINGDPGQLPVSPFNLSLKGDPTFVTTGPTIPANTSHTSLNYGFLNVPWYMVFDRPKYPYLSGGNQHNRNTRNTYQADLTYSLDRFGGRHTFVVSADYSKDTYYRHFPLVNTEAVLAAGIIPGWSQFFGSITDQPYARYIDPFTVGFDSRSFGWLPLDVLTLNYNQIPDLKKLLLGFSDQLGANSYFAGNVREDIGFSANYQGRFAKDRLIVTGGVRRSQTKNYAYNEKGPRQDVAGNVIPATDTSSTTPMVGASARILPALVLFASYNKSYQVPAGFEGGRNPIATNQQTGVTEGGELFPTEKGVGYDIGLKTDFRDNTLSGTISFFRVDRENILVQDAAREKRLRDAGFSWTDTFRSASGLQRVEGIEGDFVYTPNRNYQALVAVTHYSTYKIVQDDPSSINVVRGGTYTGSIAGDMADQHRPTLANIPEYRFSFFNKYTFSDGTLKNFSVGAGVTYQSGFWTSQDQSTTVFQGDVGLVDLYLSHRLQLGRSPLEISLTVNNVLDRLYFGGPVAIAAPRTWKLNASFKF
jgi:outer membrane receptor protein involved in Fe transport